MKAIRALEVCTNVVLLSVALLFGAALLRHSSGTEASGARSRSAGDAGIKRVSVQDIGETRSRVTVVLGLSTTCGYCARNLPLYAKLASLTRTTPELRVVALFPQSVDEAQRYLRANGVDVRDVRSTDLTRLGISGTPTILLVRQDGTVVSSWAGMVPEPQQPAVLERVTQAAAAP